MPADEFNLIFSLILDFASTGPDVTYDFIYAQFIYDSHSLGRHSELYESVFTFHPKSVIVYIREKSSFSLVIGVGDVVSCHGSFSSDLALS